MDDDEDATRQSEYLNERKKGEQEAPGARKQLTRSDLIGDKGQKGFNSKDNL